MLTKKSTDRKIAVDTTRLMGVNAAGAKVGNKPAVGTKPATEKSSQ